MDIDLLSKKDRAMTRRRRLANEGSTLFGGDKADTKPEQQNGVASPAAEPVEVRKTKALVKSMQIDPPIANSMLAIIARAASDKNVDVEKMRALLEIQKEIRQEEARLEFIRAFISASLEMPSVNKDGRIVMRDKAGKTTQNTPFATYENMHRTCMPVLLKNGFAFWTEPDLHPADVSVVVMRGHLDHVAGHSTSCAMVFPIDSTGSKNANQGRGSSFAYMRRYCLMNLLNVRSEAKEDRDRDGDPGARRDDEPEEKASGEQIDALRKAIADCGATEAMVLKKYNVEDLKNFPAHLIAAALSACANFKQRTAPGQNGGS